MPDETLCKLTFFLLSMTVHIVIIVMLAATQCCTSLLLSNATVSKGLLPGVTLFYSRLTKYGLDIFSNSAASCVSIISSSGRSLKLVPSGIFFNTGAKI